MNINDIDPPMNEITAHLGQDLLLEEPMRATPGLRAPGAFDQFETALMMLLNQHARPREASELMDRIISDTADLDRGARAPRRTLAAGASVCGHASLGYAVRLRAAGLEPLGSGIGSALRRPSGLASARAAP